MSADMSPRDIPLSCDLHSIAWLEGGGWTLTTHIKRTKPVKMLAQSLAPVFPLDPPQCLSKSQLKCIQDPRELFMEADLGLPMKLYYFNGA